MLVVTIGIGVDYAGLNFGSSNSKKGSRHRLRKISKVGVE